MRKIHASYLLLLTLCILMNSNSLAGQSSDPPGSAQNPIDWRLWGSFDAGIMWGSSTITTDLRVQGGVKNANGWMLGLGVAHDRYRFESMPVYAQVRKLFSPNRRRSIFAMASLGGNIALEKDWTSPVGWFNPELITYSYGSGFFGEAGAGFAFRLRKKWGAQLSLSYSLKNMSESYNTRAWIGSQPGPMVMNQNIYMLNRFVIRAGIGF